jgi:TonB family protein
MNGINPHPLPREAASRTITAASRRADEGARRATALVRSVRCGTMALLFVMILTGTAPAQQEEVRLAAARSLYVSARYEDALQVLDALRADAHPDRKLVEMYRSLCLLALGRSEDAERAIAAVVTADPTYEPDDAEASPRVRAAFAEVRRQLLPGLAMARYAAAKAAYDRHDWREAESLFGLVLALIDDPATGGRLGDLRLLAAGFHELSTQAGRAAVPEMPSDDEPPATPAIAAPAVAARAPDAPHDGDPVEAEHDRIYSLADSDVLPPVTIRQDLPRLPGSLRDVRARGQLEIVIDELGRVVSMAIRESIHSTYDRQVLAAARDWKYEPASVAGRPVRFRKLIQINVSR